MRQPLAQGLDRRTESLEAGIVQGRREVEADRLALILRRDRPDHAGDALDGRCEAGRADYHFDFYAPLEAALDDQAHARFRKVQDLDGDILSQPMRPLTALDPNLSPGRKPPRSAPVGSSSKDGFVFDH